MVDTKGKRLREDKKEREIYKMIGYIWYGEHDICLMTYILKERVGNNDI